MLKEKKLLTGFSVFVFLVIGLAAGQASAAVSDNGITAYYPFSGNANDASGNGYDGVVYGAELASDRFGNPASAYHFDGQDYINVQINSEVFHGDFTISVWVNFDHFNNDYPCILIGNNQDITLHGMGPIFDIDKIGNIVFYQMDDTNFESIGLFDSLTKLNIGEWYLISIVKSDLNFSMYIDNILRNQITADHDLSMSDSYLTIGSRRDFDGGIPWKGYENSTLNGYIDDIRIYDRALSEVEISELYGTPVCGDGVKNGDEACDYEDASGEGIPEHYICSQTCGLVYVPYCGDGIKNGNEECDGLDGLGVNQECTPGCTLADLPYCGDGIKDENEQCDDGNSEIGDGCDDNCLAEPTPDASPFARLIRDTKNLYAAGEIKKAGIKKELLAKFNHLEQKYEKTLDRDRCILNKITASYIGLALKHAQTKIKEYSKSGRITPSAAELLNADIEDILSFVKEEYWGKACILPRCR
ncbi:MAG: LamG-like jellyroll fold domain-containing protein [Candidatus Falkowbacteria bacterium]